MIMAPNRKPTPKIMARLCAISIALLYVLAGLLIGLWLGPLLLTSGRLELVAIAWAALPAWLMGGLLSYIAWADKSGRYTTPTTNPTEARL